jgi:hypothetical protein
MNRHKHFLTFALFIALGIFGCEPTNRLERTIEQELASGEKQDSLFLGLKFGVNKSEFFEHCWKLNKEGVITNGTENMSVLYNFRGNSDYEIAFNFYPKYEDGIAHKFNASFNYVAWAPWNKQLQSDDLMPELATILEEWYGGNKFIEEKKKDKTYYHKIDGNRQITIYIRDERHVNAVFSDLSYYSPIPN